MLTHYEMTTIADMLYSRIADNMKAGAEPEHMMFAEAREKLGIGDQALRNRLTAAGVKTYYRNGGKAFDRKHFNKLR